MKRIIITVEPDELIRLTGDAFPNGLLVNVYELIEFVFEMYADGNISEGSGCKLLGIDRLDFRHLVNNRQERTP